LYQFMLFADYWETRRIEYTYRESAFFVEPPASTLRGN
jgi:hypothetical protein